MVAKLAVFLFAEPEEAEHLVPETHESQCADGSCALLLQISEPEPQDDAHRRSGKSDQMRH